MDKSSWLERLRKLARQDTESLSLVADLRWITEYANTDGFTQSVRLDARYEVYERESMEVKDKGLADVVISQAQDAVWQSKQVKAVAVQIIRLGGFLKFADDAVDKICFYFDPASMRMIGFEFDDGKWVAMETVPEIPNKWTVDQPQQIGVVKFFDPKLDEQREFGLFAYAEAFEDDRYAFRIEATPPDNQDDVLWTTSWVTESDGVPRLHFCHYASMVQETEVLISLMIRL